MANSFYIDMRSDGSMEIVKENIEIKNHEKGNVKEKNIVRPFWASLWLGEQVTYLISVCRLISMLYAIISICKCIAIIIISKIIFSTNLWIFLSGNISRFSVLCLTLLLQYSTEIKQAFYHTVRHWTFVHIKE